MAVSKNTAIVVAAKSLAAGRENFLAINKQMGNPLIWERECRFALQHIEKSDILQSCDQNTIRDSIINVGTMGLSLNPATQQVALIPRWNAKKRMMDCTASPMYRGLIKLALDAGAVKTLQADVIYEDDEYDVTLGSTPELIHKPHSIIKGEGARVTDFKDLDRNRLVAVYVVATTDSGEKLITMMGLEDCLRVANASDSFNPKKANKKASGPWIPWADQMSIKSVIRRAQKTWPTGDNKKWQEALEAAIQTMTDADTNDMSEGVIEGEATTVISEDQDKELRDLCRQQGMPVAQLYKLYGIEKMSHLSIDKFPEVKTKLLQRLAKYQEKHGEAA